MLQKHKNREMWLLGIKINLTILGVVMISVTSLLIIIFMFFCLAIYLSRLPPLYKKPGESGNVDIQISNSD